jgi:hypothetical protein
VLIRLFPDNWFIIITENGVEQVFSGSGLKCICSFNWINLDTENLNLDGTHSYVKKSCESVGCQCTKKGRTSNVLIMTDCRGIPIAIGGIQSGNRNDLYQIVSTFPAMIKPLNRYGIVVENSILNADKGFDSNKLLIACRRRHIEPNIKENSRNRKKAKRGRK